MRAEGSHCHCSYYGLQLRWRLPEFQTTLPFSSWFDKAFRLFQIQGWKNLFVPYCSFLDFCFCFSFLFFSFLFSRHSPHSLAALEGCVCFRFFRDVLGGILKRERAWIGGSPSRWAAEGYVIQPYDSLGYYWVL